MPAHAGPPAHFVPNAMEIVFKFSGLQNVADQLWQVSEAHFCILLGRMVGPQDLLSVQHCLSQLAKAISKSSLLLFARCFDRIAGLSLLICFFRFE